MPFRLVIRYTVREKNAVKKTSPHNLRTRFEWMKMSMFWVCCVSLGLAAAGCGTGVAEAGAPMSNLVRSNDSLPPIDLSKYAKPVAGAKTRGHLFLKFGDFGLTLDQFRDNVDLVWVNVVRKVDHVRGQTPGYWRNEVNKVVHRTLEGRPNSEAFTKVAEGIGWFSYIAANTKHIFPDDPEYRVVNDLLVKHGVSLEKQFKTGLGPSDMPKFALATLDQAPVMIVTCSDKINLTYQIVKRAESSGEVVGMNQLSCLNRPGRGPDATSTPEKLMYDPGNSGSHAISRITWEMKSRDGRTIYPNLLLDIPSIDLETARATDRFPYWSRISIACEGEFGGLEEQMAQYYPLNYLKPGKIIDDPSAQTLLSTPVPQQVRKVHDELARYENAVIGAARAKLGR